MVDDNTEPKAERKAPTRLPVKVRRFIVQQLACYERPADVRKAALEQFPELAEAGIEVTENKVRALDPTQARGLEMADELRRFFWTTREKYDAAAEAELIGTLKHRLALCHTIAARALAKGNEQLVLQALKQAAQDKGGVFTNRRELSGPNGKPVETVSMSLEDWKREAAVRASEVADTMSMFDEAPVGAQAAGGEAEDA